MQVYGSFPAARMRRMRRDDFSRRLMREHVLTADDLIYPVFLIEGRNRTQAVPSMPGVSRYTPDRFLPVAERCLKLGVPAVALFPSIEPGLKTPEGKEATNPDGLIPRTIALLKKKFPELGVMTDVALDPYTSHGQDGLIDDDGYIVNDETLAVLERQALVQAQAGVDIVAPSDMMDGRIGRIRSMLEDNQFIHTRIMAYSKVRVGLLRSVSRRGRLGGEPGQGEQVHLPDGPGQQRRGALGGGARPPGGSRHGDGEAGDALSRYRPAREGRVQGADLRVPGERRILDAQGRVQERVAERKAVRDGGLARLQARR